MSDTPSETAPMKPALTAEEWERWDRKGDHDLATHIDVRSRFAVFGTDGYPTELDDRERHALAALALYGQPFGFSWQDVWNLRNVPALEIHHIADKIAALLPPEPR